ncbi:hypothetical protein MBLNU230_g4728t1 [Neophaeotheca triangularis]
MYELRQQERQKPCSGRDELCNSVLNDEWASHPTWASEDSGFIAHKKNVNEEGLHRIEEERHDYDFNIEACNRTIQLLEPIAQQLRRMSDADQEMYKLPPGLGGQSEAIYKRVIMKLYGRDRGQTVIERLEESPYLVIPVLLNRLKERLETWKMAQREWEKVWRDQTSKMFYKSLDHQSASFKNNLGKTFQQKALQSEIAVKYEDMKRQEPNAPGLLRKPQMIFDIQDHDVLIDATHLVLAYIDQNQSTEQPRLLVFIREFMPVFFGLDVSDFNTKIKERLGETPPTGELNDDSASGAEDGASKIRKGNSKNGSLLRATLSKGKGRGAREDSNTPASRASTPGMDTASNAAEDEVMAETADEADDKAETASTRWIDPAAIGASENRKPVPNVNANDPHKRDTYRMYANPAIYCFVRMVVVLYERLHKLKLAESDAKETVKNAKKFKPASELGISDKGTDEFFEDTSENANYYRQMLRKLEDVARGEIEFTPDVEETLRRFYLQTGYPLYAFEKILQALSKFATVICSSDGKDKTPDIYQLFKRDRVKETTTATQQMDYRRAVEKLVKDGELYRIEMNSPATSINMRIMKKDDPTLASDLSPLDQENRWRYYIGSYTSVDPTEGVDHKALRLPLLPRNLRAFGADPSSVSYPPSPRPDDPIANERLMRRFDHQKGEESLVMRIAVDSYFRIFEPNTFEGWFESMSERQGGKEGVDEAIEAAAQRKETVNEGFELMNAGMKGLSKSEVEAKNENFTKMVQEGVHTAEAEDDEEQGNAMEVD